jgi:hypothetical protein
MPQKRDLREGESQKSGIRQLHEGISHPEEHCETRRQQPEAEQKLASVKQRTWMKQPRLLYLAPKFEISCVVWEYRLYRRRHEKCRVSWRRRNGTLWGSL